MTTGPSNTPLSERLAERKAQQLGALEQSTQELLNEHESALQQLLNDARRTTENAIREQSLQLDTALNNAAAQQRQQLESIEQRLSTAAAQAERLSRAGGLRSWTRHLAITVAVTLGVTMGISVAVGGGLKLTDRLIASRWEELATLKQEIQSAEQAPRLPQGVKIQALSDGRPYLIGVDPDTAWAGTINNGQTPVIRLTEE